MTIDPKLYGAGPKWTVTFEPEQAPVPRGSENGNRYSPTGREMLTHTGRLVDLAALRPEDICMGDIAYHLAGTERFGGAHPRRVSVAQHSLAVEHIAGELWARNGPMADNAPVDFTALRRAALMHDAAEAYVGDATGAVKLIMRELTAAAFYPGAEPMESAYDELEDSVQAVIEAKYGITRTRAIDEIVHEADCIACAYEMQMDGWHPTDCPAWALEDAALARCYRAPNQMPGGMPYKDGGKRLFGALAFRLGLSD